LNSISGKEEEDPPPPSESEEAEVEDSAFFSASETFAKQGDGDLLREAKRDKDLGASGLSSVRFRGEDSWSSRRSSLLIDASCPHGLDTDISLRARQELLQAEREIDALKQQQKAIAEGRLFGISSLQRQLLQVQHEREAQVQYEADLHQHDAVLRAQTYKTYYTTLHPLPSAPVCWWNRDAKIEMTDA
jgi:hypothetical protein